MHTDTSFLVVEDELLTSLMYRKALNKYGIVNIKRATSAEEAVDTFRVTPVDIVFMDINLAGNVSGIEAARRIQAIGNPQIVFITGYQDAALRQEAEKLSPAGYYTKPVDIPEVLAKLSEN